MAEGNSECEDELLIDFEKLLVQVEAKPETKDI